MTSGFIEILIEDTGVQAVVGLNQAGNKYKVYPLRAPQKEEIDYVTVFKGQNEAVPSLTKDTVSGLDYPRMTVACWSKNFRKTEMMYEAVRLALDGFSGITDAGYILQRVWLIDDSDGFNDESQLYCHIAVFGVEQKRIGTDLMQSIVNSNFTLWGGVWVFADHSNQFPSPEDQGAIYIAGDNHGNPGEAEFVPTGAMMISLIGNPSGYSDFTINL